LTVDQAEQVFLKCSEDKSMLGHLHAEIQSIGKKIDPPPPEVKKEPKEKNEKTGNDEDN
jgi:hypothetical protein